MITHRVMWLKRRWFEFRIGHNTYLSFFLSFVNFLLISYNFLFSQIPFIQGVISSIGVFAVILILCYVPLAVLVGHFHNQQQLYTDTIIQADANPYWQRIMDQTKSLESKVDALGCIVQELKRER